MNSSVLLLWALAACVRFACTEGDPLPPALVELVRSGPISSIRDLQLLLEPDSVDEDPDSQTSKRRHANGASMRFPRSLAVEEAQQARCEVRTEVLEVTRDMLDRRNANFMLWPPCVEVQRCSGCCNSRTLQCIPIVTRTRYLQVMKIQYINKKTHYEKAIISVQDHVQCRCQSSTPSPVPRTTARKPQHALQPQRPAPKSPAVKTPSKEELHQQDELKQNQNPNLWPDVGDPQRPVQPASPALAPATTTRAQTSRSPITEQTHGGDGKEPQPTQETRRAPGDEGERNPPQSGGDGSTVLPPAEHRPQPHPHGPNANTTAQQSAPERPTGTHTHHTLAGFPLQQGSESHNHSDSHNHDRNHSQDHNQNHSYSQDHKDNHNHSHNQNHHHNHSQDHKHNQNHNQNQESHHNHSQNQEHRHNHNHNHHQNHKHNHHHSHDHSHSHNHDHNQTETTDQRQDVTELQKERELLEKEAGQLLQLSLQEEQERLLLQRKLDQEKERLKQQEELHRQHPPHHREQVPTTTQRPVTTALTTARPPQTQRPPVRHVPVHRRPRKHRRRISKKTMRAMLM